MSRKEEIIAIMKSTVLKTNNGNVSIKIVEGITMKDAAKIFAELTENTENYDDGFYVCDLGEVAKLYKIWTELFPRIRPFYAIKAAPHGPMVAILAAIGGAFDSASQEETELALACGASPDDIIFTNPHKPFSHIDHAKKNGINTLVFDDEPELHKIKKKNPTADLLLRIKRDDKASLLPFHGRFGVALENGFELIRTAKQLELNVVGVCFHIGSYCTDTKGYTKALHDAKQLFDFAKSLGMRFTVLDIGGGFHSYSSPVLSLDKIASEVNTSIDAIFPIEQYRDLTILAEPGRYFAATSFTMATNIISKLTPSRFDEVEAEYTISEGKYGGMIFLYDSVPGEYEPFIYDEAANRNKHYARLWGPTCDSEDQVKEKILIPKVEQGDWLYWKNAGAYSFALSTGFNGFRTSVIHNVISTENEKVFWTLCNEKICRIEEVKR